MSSEIEKIVGEARALLKFVRERGHGPAPYYMPSGLKWDQVSQVANMLSELTSKIEALSPQERAGSDTSGEELAARLDRAAGIRSDGEAKLMLDAADLLRTLSRALAESRAEVKRWSGDAHQAQDFMRLIRDESDKNLARAEAAERATPGDGYVLTMRSGVSSMNDNVIGTFRDYATALMVGGMLYEVDQLSSPEYRTFDVKPQTLRAMNEQVIWTHCVFQGPPPEGYSDWNQWIGAATKMGATIRASKPEDWTTDGMK